VDFQLPDAERWYQRCPDLAQISPGLKYRWRFAAGDDGMGASWLSGDGGLEHDFNFP